MENKQKVWVVLRVGCESSHPPKFNNPDEAHDFLYLAEEATGAAHQIFEMEDSE